MKDEEVKSRFDFEKIRSLAKKGGYLLSFFILVGVIYSIYWFGKSFYEDYFIAQRQLFSLNLSNFKYITVLGKNDCLMGDGPIFLSIARPLNELIYPEMDFESDKSIDFQLSFPFGHLSAKGYKSDNSVEDIALTKTEEVTFLGTASQLKVEYLNLNSLVMKQQFCANEIILYPYPNVSFSPLDNKTPKTVWTEQTFGSQDKIRVTITNPNISENMNTKGYERIEFEFVANEGFLTFNVGASANDLKATVPTIMENFGKHPFELLIIRSKQYQIEHPVGTLKFGNNAPTTLDAITTTSDDTLLIRYNEYYLPGNPLNSKSSDIFEITGMADNLILNNEEKIQPRWYSLPEYIQAGLFGFLLSIIGGIWTLRQPIGKWLLSLFPFLKPNYNPPSGSFILVMDSGVVIAGELSRKPTKNYPYFLIKKARRKLSLSGEWEKELIPEIKIRSDAVEQSYVE